MNSGVCGGGEEAPGGVTAGDQPAVMAGARAEAAAGNLNKSTDQDIVNWVDELIS